MSSPLNVHSEIGPLKKVLVHCPGNEYNLFPVEEFDYVWSHACIFQKVAAQEHDAFVRLMRSEGVDVIYLKDLVIETIEKNPEARTWLTERYLAESGIGGQDWLEAVRDQLDSIVETRDFVDKLTFGFQRKDLALPDVRNQSLRDFEGLRDHEYNLTAPLPGLNFTRDPFAVIGNGVTIHNMGKPQRNRETMFGDAIFRFHPDYRQAPVLYRHDAPYHIEGGDILNIDAKTLAIGLSDRTEAGAIDLLAQGIFWGDNDSQIETIYAFKIPKAYAFMHLDTVFTQVDYETFTYYPGIIKTLVVYRITRGAHEGGVRIDQLDGSLEDILKRICGLTSIRLLECGGGEPMLASREQWNDGSNTLAISPGVVAVYERNEVTNDILYREGLRLLVIPSAELSLGRGGPRCMTMPFWREEI